MQMDPGVWNELQQLQMLRHQQVRQRKCRGTRGAWDAQQKVLPTFYSRADLTTHKKGRTQYTRATTL